MIGRIYDIVKSSGISSIDNDVKEPLETSSISSISTTVYDLSPWFAAEESGIVKSRRFASCETSLMRFSYDESGGFETITFYPIEEVKNHRSTDSEFSENRSTKSFSSLKCCGDSENFPPLLRRESRKSNGDFTPGILSKKGRKTSSFYSNFTGESFHENGSRKYSDFDDESRGSSSANLSSKTERKTSSVNSNFTGESFCRKNTDFNDGSSSANLSFSSKEERKTSSSNFTENGRQNSSENCYFTDQEGSRKMDEKFPQDRRNFGLSDCGSCLDCESTNEEFVKFLPVLSSERLVRSSVFLDLQHLELKNWLERRPDVSGHPDSVRLHRSVSDDSLLMKQSPNDGASRKAFSADALLPNERSEDRKKRVREKAILFTDRLDPQKNLSYLRTTTGNEDDVYVAAFVILSTDTRRYSTDISYLLTNLLKSFFDPWEEFAVVWVPDIRSTLDRLLDTSVVSSVFANQPIHGVEYWVVLVLTQDAAHYFRHKNLAFLKMLACLVQCDVNRILVIKLNE